MTKSVATPTGRVEGAGSSGLPTWWTTQGFSFNVKMVLKRLFNTTAIQVITPTNTNIWQVLEHHTLTPTSGKC